MACIGKINTFCVGCLLFHLVFFITMVKNQIKRTANKYFQQLNKSFKKLEKHFDADTIHGFRVAYKKLRAFLRMLAKQQGKSGELKISKELKKVYQLSGAIRDLQLQQQRIIAATKYRIKKPDKYLVLLDRQIDNLKPALKKMLVKNFVLSCKRKAMIALPDEFPLNRFREFINQKWEAINTILVTGLFSDDNIHSVRKALKDFFYNLQIYEGPVHEVLAISVWKGMDAKYIDELLNELGDFQDKCTAIALLKTDWLVQLKTDNRTLLKQVKKRWIQDKRVVKHSLVSKLTIDFKAAAGIATKIK